MKRKLIKTKPAKNMFFIDPRCIVPNPYQPRREFPEAELQNLALSIKQNGVIQPLTVRKIAPTAAARGRYELISGERRLRASKMAGLAQVPCVLWEADDEESAVLALVENLQRSDLNFFEEAAAIQKLISSRKMTQQEAAEKLGRSQSAVANKLRLLKLSPEQRGRIARAGLTERHARALLKFSNEKVRDELLDFIIAKGLNVEQTEKKASELESHIREEEEKRRGIRRVDGQPGEKKQQGQTFKPILDVRLFFNTINHAIESMKESGVNIWSTKTETEDVIEYKVYIAKSEKVSRGTQEACCS